MVKLTNEQSSSSAYEHNSRIGQISNKRTSEKMEQNLLANKTIGSAQKNMTVKLFCQASKRTENTVETTVELIGQDSKRTEQQRELVKPAQTLMTAEFIGQPTAEWFSQNSTNDQTAELIGQPTVKQHKRTHIRINWSTNSWMI